MPITYNLENHFQHLIKSGLGTDKDENVRSFWLLTSVVGFDLVFELFIYYPREARFIKEPYQVTLVLAGRIAEQLEEYEGMTIETEYELDRFIDFCRFLMV